MTAALSTPTKARSTSRLISFSAFPSWSLCSFEVVTLEPPHCSCSCFHMRSDYIITADCSAVRFRLTTGVLPCGIVVAPSSFEAWIRIAHSQTVWGFPEFTRFRLRYQSERSFLRTSVSSHSICGGTYFERLTHDLSRVRAQGRCRQRGNRRRMAFSLRVVRCCCEAVFHPLDNSGVSLLAANGGIQGGVGRGDVGNARVRQRSLVSDRFRC